SDKSDSKSSYAYNELMSGLQPGIRPNQDDVKEQARRQALGRIGRAVLMIEKHGSPLNAHVKLGSWDDVIREMGVPPHNLAERTGLLINGDTKEGTITQEQLQNLAGKKF